MNGGAIFSPSRHGATPGLSFSSETVGPRRGARAYFAATTFGQACALLRYVFLARLLGPEQLGIAATLIVTASFFDLISDTAADRFLIQDPDGEQVIVQRLVQLVLAGRGAGIATAMLIFAWPIAYFYKTPALAPALAILGLSPLIAGFIHLDMRRIQRGNDFRAESISSIASEAAGLVSTLLAAFLTHDFTAVLYGLIVRSLVLVLCSHVFAERTYGFNYSAEHAPRLARFSMPLMATGLVIFLGSQGDRVLISRTIGFKSLGEYSTIILSIYYPSTTIFKYLHNIYMPLISGARNDPSRRERVNNNLTSVTLMLGLAMSAGFALVAPTLIPILYGHPYKQSIMLIALVGVLQSIRFLTLWPSTIAIAMARSNVILANNVLRLIAWPAALLGVAVTHDVVGIVLGFIFGEFVAVVLSLFMLNRSEGDGLLRGADRLMLFAVGSLGIVAWIAAASHPSFILMSGLFLLSAGFLVWLARSEFVTINQGIGAVRRLIARTP